MPKSRYTFIKAGKNVYIHMAGGISKMRKYKARIADEILKKRLLGKER